MFIFVNYMKTFKIITRVLHHPSNLKLLIKLKVGEVFDYVMSENRAVRCKTSAFLRRQRLRTRPFAFIRKQCVRPVSINQDYNI
ncbi:hypothetical protein HanXRQr2_Chr07g0294941 [Helianthus annuus]|uniref:Uncharacterized protein n=1 Tax=Helianthus annuus TaxID=4232 RepID=A0A9K3IKF8_HELAN|nr:hypothetical protein HanXRQr2_Chr07g0294941 [Helianthus annuus]KAJ0904722.1 hypothetical protein HanPSC8_Chr07g0285541 [Helianthus annuus]